MDVYFWLFIILISQIHGKNEPRIDHGEITPDNLFRFTTFVHTPEGVATGSVISPRHILTCAHIIFEDSIIEENERYLLYLNRTYHAEFRPLTKWVNKSTLPISNKAYMPKDFKWPWNDIAILEFPEGTNFSVEPVKLAKDYFEKNGDEAIIAGFGDWWQNGTKTSGISYLLRHAKVSMVDDCFGTSHICGGNNTHHALLGDSGGPMVIYRNKQWYQIGISAQNGERDIRTRISSFCNFIEEVTKNEVQCESISPDHSQMTPPPLKYFEPLYKGQSTRPEVFNFVVPLYNYYYYVGCSATVISKRHLLTLADCVYKHWWTEIQPIKHSSYNTISGKLFPDLRSKNVHSNLVEPLNVTAYFPLTYDWPWENNIAVVEFPEGTDFGILPVKLAKDYIQTYSGIVAGYGNYDWKSNNLDNEGMPPILLHSNVTFENQWYGDKIVVENENLTNDDGGPTLIERNGKFYQIGINMKRWNDNGRTIVSYQCEFIEEVTKNEVQCESPALIFEEPVSKSTLPKTTTTSITTRISFQPTDTSEQQNQENPTSFASNIHLEFIYVLLQILYCLIFNFL